METRLRVLSYRVTSVEDTEDTLQSSALEDILHRQADILCLQNLSSSSPWREKLSTAGFASLWRQRTQSKAYHHCTGNLIAYRRSQFLLFRSEEIEFNSALQCVRRKSSSGGDFARSVGELTSAEREFCVADEAALMALLQPSSKDGSPRPSLCIACAAFDERLPSACRDILTRYLLIKLEDFNGSYSLPVVMGMSLGDTSTSSAYHILRSGELLMSRGLLLKIQLPPVCSLFSRSSLRYCPTLTAHCDTGTTPSVCFTKLALTQLETPLNIAGAVAVDFLRALCVSLGWFAQ